MRASTLDDEDDEGEEEPEDDGDDAVLETGGSPADRYLPPNNGFNMTTGRRYIPVFHLRRKLDF